MDKKYIIGCGIGLLIIVIYITIHNLNIHTKNIFDDIYNKQVWGKGSIYGGSSGHGSSLELNNKYISYLNNFIKNNNINSIVDIGCGDWQIMENINLSNIDYKGIDVVNEVINANNKKYKKNNIHFYKINIDEYYDYPKADLLICKDVLQHLDYKNINYILSQFNKYNHSMIINDITNNTINRDIKNGGYRDLDINKEPFNININYKYYMWPEHKPTKVLSYIGMPIL